MDPEWEGEYYSGPALSPDGRFLAVGVTGVEAGSTSQLWVKELPDGPRTRLTSGDGWHPQSAWPPSGPEIAFLTSEAGNYDICVTRADGTSPGSCQVLLDLENSVADLAYTPEGDGFVFRFEEDLGLLVRSTGEVDRKLLATDFVERDAAFSPDGRWLAYSSNSSGRYEVYVRPFPDVESRIWQVSTGGGRYPLWANNGRELVYRGGDRWVIAATYTADSVFNVQTREPLFDPGFTGHSTWRDWDIAPSDDRFVMVVPNPFVTRTIQILNFFTELEERMGR